jgi:hypothetical protein
MFSARNSKILLKPFLAALTVFAATFSFVPELSGKAVVEKKGDVGVIKGIVRDESGSPIANAYVSIFRVGTSRLLKQVRSAADGSFLAKIIPGTYTILAVAQGFNSVTLGEVEVNRATELSYGFKLERSGDGNTLPEKRLDRNSSKWRIRAAQNQRSIYQNQSGTAPVNENELNQSAIEASITVAERSDETTKRSGQTVVETYFADSTDGSFTGVNFATFLPVSENSEIVVAGQTGTGSAPQRLETNLKFRPNETHQIRFNTSFGNLGKVKIENTNQNLGQVSVQALDEWKVRDDLILVLGFDYSRFVGAGEDFSLTPRIGAQFDLNAKTRIRSAFTAAPSEEKNWARAIELEGSTVAFTEPVSMEDFTVENGRPQMNKSSRLEFGVERILDNDSSVEANAFFDATLGRGVGLTNLPFNVLGTEDFADFVANQQGRASGVRVVYWRRVSSRFSTSAGFAYGSGQKLSDKGISSPTEIFENDFFQTFYGQFDADLKTGTNIKTIFRLSPQATVFAIDPFQGRLAIYDPGLSVLVTQSLPTLGLPIRAQAVVDARNLLDFQTSAFNEEGSLRLNSQGRTLRGGISLRF